MRRLEPVAYVAAALGLALVFLGALLDYRNLILVGGGIFVATAGIAIVRSLSKEPPHLLDIGDGEVDESPPEYPHNVAREVCAAAGRSTKSLDLKET